MIGGGRWDFLGRFVTRLPIGRGCCLVASGSESMAKWLFNRGNFSLFVCFFCDFVLFLNYLGLFAAFSAGLNKEELSNKMLNNRFLNREKDKIFIYFNYFKIHRRHLSG